MKDKLLMDLASFFQALSDPNRLKIAESISRKPLSVNEICKNVDISMSAVSHQLKLLKNLNLVSYEKKGKNKYYKISDHHILCIFVDGISHVKDKGKCPYDLECVKCNRTKR